MTNAFESRYEVLEKIGEGSFSEVLKVENRLSKLQYAAKKLKKRFKSIHDVLYCAEIIATQKLCRHPNVLYMLEYIYDSFGGKVVFIFELMDMSMYEYMKLKKRLSEVKVRIYLYQMLKGLEHLHNNGLFHRDIKPENILVKLPNNSQDSSIFEGELIKLADLGSIRGIYSVPPYTEYISTRWYRSPECLLTMGNYGPKMDIWAVGCVFYEMLTMKPLFPGANEIDQLSRIHALLGTPSNRLLCKFKKRSKNFENFPHNPGGGLGPLLCNITEDSQKLLKLMLQYDPDARSNVKRLLENKYFDKMREDDFFRRYKNAEAKSKPFKKDHGDQEHAPYLGTTNSWKNSKFQNTVYGHQPLKKRPSPYDQPTQQNHKDYKAFPKEHAATTGNLHKDYDFGNNNKGSNHHLHTPPDNAAPAPSHPITKHNSMNRQLNKQYHNYIHANTNRVHGLPITEQILLGQQYSGGGGRSYGYGPPGAQGARIVQMDEYVQPKKPVPGALYSRTSVDMLHISHHQLQRPSISTHHPNQNLRHQSNTISSMMKQKLPVKVAGVQQQQQKPYRNYNSRPNVVERERSRARRNRSSYNQYLFRDDSKGSKSSKDKNKSSNNSSLTGISGKGLGGGASPKKKDKYEKNEYRGGRQFRERQRSKSGQRIALASKLFEEREQHQGHGYGVIKTSSSPVKMGGTTRNIVAGESLQVHRQGAIKNLRKRAASKSPVTTPSKHVGNRSHYVSPNAYGNGGNVGNRWSDLKRQSGECHKPLDVAPLPVCRMNIGQTALYKGYGGMASVGAVAVGAISRGIAGRNMFRKTTSNLPQIKKPVLPQHSHHYDNTTDKKELQSRSFVLPKRQHGRHKLDTIVELTGKGSRKFK